MKNKAELHTQEIEILNALNEITGSKFRNSYPLWLANYNDVLQPSDIDDWKIWQFTEQGISSGVNTKIDLNVFNGSKRKMKELLVD